MPYDKFSSSRNQHGVIGGIPEAVIALTVAGGLMAGFAVMSNKSSDDIRIQNTAYQMRQLRDATELFMRQNYQALSTVGANQAIPVATLRANAVLTASFPDNNPLNQVYGIRIADSNGAAAGGSLTALVYTTPGANSTVLTPEQAAKAASLSGSEGGYVAGNTADWSAGSGGVCAAAGNCAVGSFGSWRVDDLNATFGVTPGAGGLASTGFVSEASMASDALYRTNIGLPLANTMTTTMYGGTVGDINGNGTIDTNEVGASRGTGYTFDANTGTYQMGGQLTVGAFDTNADGINDAFGANTTNNQGVTMTTAGLVDARSRIASPVFDNNGNSFSLSTTASGSTININAETGTVISNASGRGEVLTIQNNGSNFWFGQHGLHMDAGWDGGGDRHMTFMDVNPVGSGAVVKFARSDFGDNLPCDTTGIGVVWCMDMDAQAVYVPNGVLQSKVRTASPIFDNNGDSLWIRTTNNNTANTIYTTGSNSYNAFLTTGANSNNIIQTQGSNSYNTMHTFGTNSPNYIQTFTTDGTSPINLETFSSDINITAGRNNPTGSHINMFADQGTIISANGSSEVLNINLGNGVLGGNVWFGNGPGEMKFDGGDDSRFGFKNVTVGGITRFMSNDDTHIFIMNNSDYSVSIPNGDLFVAGDVRVGDTLLASNIRSDNAVQADSFEAPVATFVPGGTCRAVATGNPGFARIECN